MKIQNQKLFGFLRSVRVLILNIFQSESVIKFGLCLFKKPILEFSINKCSLIFVQLLMCNQLAVSLLAQPKVESVQKFSFKEGLSDRAINHITIDSRGFLWIATKNGLNRYIGHKVEVFSNNSEPPYFINENRIREVTEIKGKKLALLSDSKEPTIEILDIDNFQSNLIDLTTREDIEDRIAAVYIERLGKIYVLTLSDHKYIIYEMDESAICSKVAEIAIQGSKNAGEIKFVKNRDGHFWILDSQNGLLKYLPDSKQYIHHDINKITSLTSASNTSYSTSILYEDVQGILWVAFPFRNGLLQQLPNAASLIKAPGFPPNQIVQCYMGRPNGAFAHRNISVVWKNRPSFLGRKKRTGNGRAVAFGY